MTENEICTFTVVLSDENKFTVVLSNEKVKYMFAVVLRRFRSNSKSY